MGKSVKLRAYRSGDEITVKCIISHPMENGLRKVRKTGKNIPPHYIREVIVSRNNRIVMEAFWGKSVSRNPYLSFQVPGKQGDRITISWLDNRGNSDSGSIRVR